MARGVNKVILIGNIGQDIELKALASGVAVANARLAVNESWKDKDTGEKKERVEWITLQFWRGLADIAAKYLRKGSQVYIEGKIQTRKWQDKEGNDRYSTEVVVNELQMLGGPRGDGAQEQEQRSAPAQTAAEKALDDDDIPF